MSLSQTLAIALIFCIGCASQVPATESPQPAVATTSDWIVDHNSQPLVLRETTGATISLVPIVSPSDEGKVNYFLFQAVRTGSPHDGLVIIVKKVDSKGASSFESQIGAQPYEPLLYDSDTNRWTYYGYKYGERKLNLRVLDAPINTESLLRLRKQQEEGTRLENLVPTTLAHYE